MVKVLPRRLRHPFLKRFLSSLEAICLLLDRFWQVVFIFFCYCSFGDVDVDSSLLFRFRMFRCCSFLFRSLFMLVYFTIALHIFNVCPLFSFRAKPARILSIARSLNRSIGRSLDPSLAWSDIVPGLSTIYGLRGVLSTARFDCCSFLFLSLFLLVSFTRALPRQKMKLAVF